MKAKFYGRRMELIDIGGKPLNQKEKEYILELNSKGLKNVDIAKQTKRHVTTICRVLKSFNIEATNHKKLNQQEIANIIKTYSSGKTIEQISEQYPHATAGAVNYHLRKAGITRGNGKQVTLLHDYFETIDSEAKAYFLGLIAADGSAMKRKRSKNGYSHIIRLELMVSDKYIIEALKNELGSNLKVRDYKSSNNREGWKEKHNAYIAFHSKKMFNDLNKYGIGINKTINLKHLPNLNEKMMRHFIRGFFDGDGTVYTASSKYKKPRPIFGFYGTYEFITSLQDYLINKLKVSKRKVIKQKDANVSFVTYSTIEDIQNFYKYIYEDATIYLHRKKEKFDLHIDSVI